MEELSTAVVRKILKGAGLVPAKRDVSSNVRKTHGMGGSYATVRVPGFTLKHETEYRAKRHERTGRVQVDMLLSSWHADEAKAAADVAQAIEALTAAGLTATRTDVAHQIVVAR